MQSFTTHDGTVFKFEEDQVGKIIGNVNIEREVCGVTKSLNVPFDDLWNFIEVIRCSKEAIEKLKTEEPQ